MSLGTILIRADASVAIGTGHVMRCLSLAQAWQDAGGTAMFVMAESVSSIDERLQSEKVDCVRLKLPAGSADDAHETGEIARAREAKWVVLDGYQFEAEYQRRIKNTGVKLFLLDDGGQSDHYLADVVLDQNFDAVPADYAKREPYTKLLLGSEYALLQRRFRRWSAWQRGVSQLPNRILVMVGGTDPDGLTFRILEAVPFFSNRDLEISVVAGGSNPHLSRLRETVKNLGGSGRLYVEPADISELMANSDIAIICGGGTLWELLFMGCATVSYARNHVQEQIIARLGAMGVVCNLGCITQFDAARLGSALCDLAGSPDVRRRMAEAGRNLIDAYGVDRVVQVMTTEA